MFFEDSYVSYPSPSLIYALTEEADGHTSNQSIDLTLTEEADGHTTNQSIDLTLTEEADGHTSKKSWLTTKGITNTLQIGNFTCTECNKKYNHYSSLYKHKIRVHPTQSIGKINCKENGCSFNCHFIAKLRHHLTVKHCINMKEEQIIFSTHKGKNTCIPIPTLNIYLWKCRI